MTSQITFKDYPYWPAESMDDLKDQMRQICNTRKDDITQISNLVNVFVLGRKVGKVPASSVDVTATDRIGDFNVDTAYAYYLIDDSGVAKWRRVAVASW